MATSTKTPAKTAAKKPAAPAKAPAKRPAKSAVAAKPVKTAVAGKPAKAKGHNPVKPEQRRNYIEVAAYFIAERHGFTPGRELTDWAAAEEEIDRLLAAGLLNP